MVLTNKKSRILLIILYFFTTLLLISCGDDGGKMARLNEGLQNDKNYTFKAMNVGNVKGWKRGDGTVVSDITLYPNGQYDYAWTFTYEGDLTDFKAGDRINIDTTGNKITSYGSLWPGMGTIVILLNPAMPPTFAFFFARIIYGIAIISIVVSILIKLGSTSEDELGSTSEDN